MSGRPANTSCFEDEELQAVALESTRTIDIDCFVPPDSIGWIWDDTPHYLIPDDTVGEEAFSVIREAMVKSNTRAISRVVLHHRERAVLLEPRDKGVILWTLRYGDEVRDAKPYFADIKSAKPERKLVDMVQQLIKERSKPWDPDMVHDPVQERLLDIVASKRKGKRLPKVAKEEEPERPSNVISIVDALKKSLAAEGKRGRKR
jgi:DNA end-binding protein Ku